MLDQCDFCGFIKQLYRYKYKLILMSEDGTKSIIKQHIRMMCHCCGWLEHGILLDPPY